jgi:hypothetical protein
MIDVRGGIVQLVKESPMMALKALRQAFRPRPSMDRYSLTDLA